MSIPRARQLRSVCHRLGFVLPIAMFLACPKAEAVSAATPPPLAERSVAVSPPSCRAGLFSMVPFLDSLRVELAGSKLACCTLTESSSGATAWLRVSVEIVPCSSDGQDVQVSVHGESDGGKVERTISLADVVATARPRALALAVAELIRLLGQVAQDKAPVPGADLVQESPPAPSPYVRPVSLSIHVEGETRVVPTLDTTMWGGRARFTAPWHKLHLDVDVGIDYASAQDDLGEVLWQSASIGLGVGPRFSSRMAIFDLGLRAELGWAWIHGETSFSGVRTQAGSDFVSNLGLRISVEVPAGMKVRPGIALEAGPVLHGMKGEVSSRPVVGMTGYYMLVALGLVASP
ncbi:MAG TPA: hypothetical protein VF550_02745 [Polyangia bacterium]